MPHVEAAHHLPLTPGTNVAMLTALAHVIVTEGLVDEAFVRERCEWDAFQDWAEFVSDERNSPEAIERITGVPAHELRAAARLYATGGNGAIYYGLGITEHSQGSTAVMAIANLAMATGNIGRPGVGVNPLRGQNNVQGSCDMGSFPHELPGYRHISDDATREIFDRLWGVKLDDEPGLRIPNMLDAAVDGSFKGLYIQGEDILQSDPDTKHVAAGLAAMECVVVHDLFLNETANYAHVFLPGSTFLEKDGTFTNAERRINMVRKVMEPKNGYADWEVTQLIAQRDGARLELHPSVADHGRDRGDDAELRRRLLRPHRREGSVQWPCNEKAPRRHAGHACRRLRARQGQVRPHRVRRDGREGRPALPAAAHHRAHPQPVQCRRADAAHRECRMARGGPCWRSIRIDAESRGIRDGDWVSLPAVRRDGAARADHRTCGARRGLHHLPPPGHPGQCGHHRFLRLGDELPGIQGDRGAGAPSNGPAEWQEEYEAQPKQSRRIADMEPAE